MSAHQLLATSLSTDFSTFTRNLGLASVQNQKLSPFIPLLVEADCFFTAETAGLAEGVKKIVGKNCEVSLMAFVEQIHQNQARALLRAYELALRDQGCSPATIRNYRSDIVQFFNFAHISTAEQTLSKPKVQLFLKSQRQKELKASSIARKLASITLFQNFVKSL